VEGIASQALPVPKVVTLMPPILAAFFALSALLHSHTLLGSARWIDPQSRSGGRVEYEYTILTTADRQFATRNVYGVLGCDVAAFAHTPGGVQMRMRINSREQELNTSWTFRYRLEAGYRTSVKFEFLDAQTGELKAMRERSFACVDELRLRDELKKAGWEIE
jgi:hypothetical protein